MAEGKPLALRRQKSSRLPRSASFEFTAEVIVDHPALHIADPYTFGVPEAMNDEISVGSWVRVPFQNKEMDGVVVSLAKGNPKAVRPILKVLKFQALGQTFLVFLRAVASRYGVRLNDIVRFVHKMPPFQRAWSTIVTRPNPTVSFQSLLQTSLSEIASGICKVKGTVLVVMPTERECDAFADYLKKAQKATIVRISGEFAASQRKNSLNKMVTEEENVVIGSRSLLFLDIPQLRKIFLFGDLSEHLWERRAPYWNARDVALLRSRIENIDLEIVDGIPSMEMARLIELGGARISSGSMKSGRQRSFSFAPDTYHATIRKALKRGSVLVSVAERGYSSSFVCAKCKTPPRCKCGGVLIFASRELVECRICQKELRDWRCSECSSPERILSRRGAERVHEEIGKAFPNTSVLISTASKPLGQFSGHSIVIATFGSEPIGTYQGLALLDGEFLLNLPLLRSGEMLLSRWAKLLSITDDDANIYLSLDNRHRISRSIMKGKFNDYVLSELRERNQLALPPWWRFIEVSANDSLLGQLSKNLLNEFPFISASAISSKGKLTLRVPVERSQEVVDSLYALQKYRSAARQRLFEIRIDPFDV